MAKKDKKPLTLDKQLLLKAGNKQRVYKNTFNVFKDLKAVSKEIASELKKKASGSEDEILVEFKEKGAFNAEIKFGGDLLIMSMHSNIFQFPRQHELMRNSYVKEDELRSYCGIINIYNFLTDSFKYNRMEDVGYLVARIFINRDLHYFVEGQRQIGLLYNNFNDAVIDKESLKEIMSTAISYCIDFDLLTPPFDRVKEVRVHEMKVNTRNMSTKTGKRLGFRFQEDENKDF